MLMNHSVHYQRHTHCTELENNLFVVFLFLYLCLCFCDFVLFFPPSLS